MNIDNLTRAQRKLAERIEGITGPHGGDLYEALIAQDAPAKDKAAVADLFGGMGVGDVFRRSHQSRRSRDRVCAHPIVYIDGIRDPFWVHADRLARHPLVPIQPDESRMEFVFESSR